MTLMDGAASNSGGEANTNSGGSTPPPSSTPPPASTGGEVSWRDVLPEEVRGNATLMKYNDLPSLAKAHISLQEMVGKKGTILPTDKSSDEEWGKLFDTLGRPPMDKYDVKLPDGKQIAPELIAGFKEAAHKAGVLPKQAQQIMDWHLKNLEESEKVSAVASQKQLSDQMTSLQKEWGEGFSKKVSQAELVLKEVGKEWFTEYLVKTGLKDDPTMVKFLAEVAPLLGEGKLRGTSEGGFGQTPGEIQEEINKIMGDTKGPYFDRSHPNHKAMNAKMEDLYKRKMG